jgi:DNA-binding transcriptional LysR family regulator
VFFVPWAFRALPRKLVQNIQSIRVRSGLPLQSVLLEGPATSRTLQRLRAMFEDDLMIRGPGGYQLTPAGVRLQQELNQLLPQIESLLGKPVFDARLEEASFRLTGLDNVCSMVCPLLCREILPSAPRVALNLVPWRESAFADLDHGRLDLVLSNDDILTPSHLVSQRLYRERWYCIVAKDSPLPERISLKRYLACEHIAVPVLEGSRRFRISDCRRSGMSGRLRSECRTLAPRWSVLPERTWC